MLYSTSASMEKRKLSPYINKIHSLVKQHLGNIDENLIKSFSMVLVHNK